MKKVFVLLFALLCVHASSSCIIQSKLVQNIPPHISNITMEPPTTENHPTSEAISPVINSEPKLEVSENSNLLSIPNVSRRSSRLDTDWNLLKIRAGNSLTGPKDQWRGLAKDLHYLENIDSVSCYWDLTSKSDVIGIENGEIVFWGTYTAVTHAFVKDALSDELLKTPPAVYSIAPDDFAYIWKLENGYVMAITMATNGDKEWYNQYLFSIVHAKHWEYLAPIISSEKSNTTASTTTESNLDFDTNIFVDTPTGPSAPLQTGQAVAIPTALLTLPESLTVDTFEQVVDLGQHLGYDESFSSAFFDQTYSESAGYRWDYIGASYSTFELPSCECNSFDIYRVIHSNGERKYFLIPFKKGSIVPRIYEFVSSTELMLIWDGN